MVHKSSSATSTTATASTEPWPVLIPVEKPPGWSPEQDLSLYHKALLRGRCTLLPPEASSAEAYNHADKRVTDVHIELRVALTSRPLHNLGKANVAQVQQQIKLSLGELIERFHDQECAFTPTHTSDGAGIIEWIRDQTMEARFWDGEHRRILLLREQGLASLCELDQLVVKMGNLASDVLEHWWYTESFTLFHDNLIAAIPECSFYFTGPSLLPDNPAGEEQEEEAA